MIGALPPRLRSLKPLPRATRGVQAEAAPSARARFVADAHAERGSSRGRRAHSRPRWVAIAAVSAARRHRQRQDRDLPAPHRRGARARRAGAGAGAGDQPHAAARGALSRTPSPRRRIALLHSALEDVRAHRGLARGARGEAAIVLGTRLAVLAPLPRLALVVVDEEHDTSFKQQEGLRYSAATWRSIARQARRLPGRARLRHAVARDLAQLHARGATSAWRCPSAPSPGARLPAVRTVDLRTEPAEHGFGAALLAAIGARLARGEQSLIFINRRGYAPVLACARPAAGCAAARAAARGWCCTPPTGGCAATIAAPKQRDPARLPDLRQRSTCTPLGRGTQRVEETLAARFPGARMVRIDRDSARSGAASSPHAARRSPRRGRHPGRHADARQGTRLSRPDAGRRAERRRRAVLDRLPRRRAPVRDAGAGRGTRRARRARRAKCWCRRAIRGTRCTRRSRATTTPASPPAQLAEREAAGFPPFVFEAVLRAEAAAARARDARSCARRPRWSAAPEDVRVYDPVPHVITRRADLRARAAAGAVAARARRCRRSCALERAAVRRRPRATCAGTWTSIRSSSTEHADGSTPFLRIIRALFMEDPKDIVEAILAQAPSPDRARGGRRRASASNGRSKPEHGDFATQRRDAAREARSSAIRASSREALSSVAEQPLRRADVLRTDRHRAAPGFLEPPAHRSREVRGSSRGCSPRGRDFGRARTASARQGPWSNSSRPIPPARCTSATAARRRWATRSRRCSRRRATRVTREFYYNDAGAQIDNLALSVQARARGKTPARCRLARRRLPRRVRRGDRRGLRRRAAATPGDLDADRAGSRSRRCAREQDADLQAFGVKFDVYYLESSLYTDGRVDAVVKALVACGQAPTSRTARCGCARPTSATTRTAWCASPTAATPTSCPTSPTTSTKWERGFRRVINVQGTDHHSTVTRVRAGLQALGLGIPAGYPDYVLHNLVKVMRGGEEVKISKRAGSYVTVRDLIDGSAATRCVSSSCRASADSEFVFDVDLAQLAERGEPGLLRAVRARARLQRAAAMGRRPASLGDARARRRSRGARELALMRRLGEFPELLAAAARELAPHSVAFYLRELAGEFHSYYNAERILVDDAATRAGAARAVRSGAPGARERLALLGVSAPERCDGGNASTRASRAQGLGRRIPARHVRRPARSASRSRSASRCT